MRVGPFGITELLIIFLIIALFFGAKRLPEFGASLGRGLRLFKSSVTGEEEETETDKAGAATRSSDEVP